MAIKIEIQKDGTVKMEDEGGAHADIMKVVLADQDVLSQEVTCSGGVEQSVRVTTQA